MFHKKIFDSIYHDQLHDVYNLNLIEFSSILEEIKKDIEERKPAFSYISFHKDCSALELLEEIIKVKGKIKLWNLTPDSSTSH